MKCSTKKIGIIGKQLPAEQREKRAQVKKIVNALKKWPKQNPWEVLLDPCIGEIMNEDGMEREKLIEKCDLIFTIGGDGTVLRTIYAVRKKSPKIVSINTGNLGFLTQVEPKNLETFLQKIIQGEYVLDTRSLLSIQVTRKEKKIIETLALNEAVINQAPFSRLLGLEVRIDGKKANELRADGVIMATPTGSTGYSLSAGGPIIHPEIDAMIINPLCSTQLSTRPIVIPGKSHVTIKIEEKTGEKTEVRITLDGQRSHAIEHGDEVLITHAAQKIHFIRLSEDNYYQRLREKLGVL